MKREVVGRLAAEFIVIVVGVLVALAVDEWRGDRADQVRVDGHLEGFVRDLSADSVQLEEALARSIGRIRAADLILEVLAASPQAPVDSARVGDSMSALGGIVSLAVATSTWDAVVSSGDLALFPDAGLRATLSGWYGAVRRLDDWGGSAGSAHRDWPVVVLESPWGESLNRAAVDDAQVAVPVSGTLRALRARPAGAREWILRERADAEEAIWVFRHFRPMVADLLAQSRAALES